MGDVLHTLPALTDAMQSIPNIEFDWVVEENFAQIPSWHPAVKKVIPVAIRRWRKNWFNTSVRKERKIFMQQLQAEHYDAVIDAQGLIKSAFLITRKANGIKHGFDKNSAREPIASWFYDKKHFVEKQQHAVERTRQLFGKSLAYQPKNQGNYLIAQHFTQSQSNQQNPYVIFFHSTTRDDKHWTESAWRDLIDLVSKQGLHVKLPWGTQYEYERACRLALDYPFATVLPKLTLSELAKEIVNSHAVVSVDTGLGHLTAALDKNNITLYGPTDPGLIGGYGKNQFVLKSPTKNMRDITAQQTFELLKNI